MDLEQILKVAVRGGASDIILKAGSVPRFRHNGQLVSLSEGVPVSSEKLAEWLGMMLPERLAAILEQKGDIDFGYDAPSYGRFRVNAFKQRGKLGLVLRLVKNHIASLDELQLPKVIESVTTLKRGLVLVTGATGSGKSTTLAAIIQKINMTKPVHIITIEDPIEFYYQDHLATINQREVGNDTPSFAEALRACLRQDPDILLVGELRDVETTETALMAAETGHLVFATLHTKDAVDSLTRLLSFFPPHQHKALRMQLAQSLQMVISQRLVPRVNGKGRVAAVEVLLANSFVREVIITGENFNSLADAIKKGGKNYGMQSFDQSLHAMLQAQIITQEQAIREASSPENMKLLISGVD